MFCHLTFAWLFMEHLSLLLDNPVRLALWPHLQVRRLLTASLDREEFSKELPVVERVGAVQVNTENFFKILCL